MNRFLLLIALTLSFALPLLSQFEGEIDMKTSTKDGETQRDRTMALMIKNDMLAISTIGSNGADKDSRFIFRQDKQMMYVVDDAKKTVMEIPTKQIEDIGAKATEGAKKKDVKFHKSGKSLSILGYSCDGWVVETEGETKEIYVTSKLGSVTDGFVKLMKKMSAGRMERMMNEFESEMVRLKLFPMKTITTRDGAVTETEEVTKVESRSLPTSTFEPPSGYTKHTMSQEMGDAMKKMQEEMMKYQKSGKMTPEMQKMMEEEMKRMGKYKSADTSKEHEE